MATVRIKKAREQEAHFGLYRTSVGGSQSIFVRRKVGEPTDYMHTKSRKLKRQRDNLTLASQHYANLTPSQKAITRRHIEEVEFIASHGKTDIKLLQGRQLFISKEIHSLATTQKQTVLPYELCIMLVDENLSPLEGILWLRHLKGSEWLEVGKEELATGSWLFSETPRGQAAYRPYGEAVGYFDPLTPETQELSEDEIRAYHYHKLLLTVDSEILEPVGVGDITQLLASDTIHWLMVKREDAGFIPPNGGGMWGWFTGDYVYKTWWPPYEQADLYHFTHPQFAAQHIYKLAVHFVAGRDTYPYGTARTILKTHGYTYYGQLQHPPCWKQSYVQDYPLNPQTNKVWTREEVQSLQAGICLEKEGSWGVVMCDHLYIKLHYI